MRIAICDDDKTIHGQLRRLIEQFQLKNNQFEISTFLSGEELVENCKKANGFDIIFLDIEMGGADGIQTAEQIRSFNDDSIIIFVSSHSQYVFKTFKFDALHFILNPIDEYEFNEVFQRAVHRYNSTHCMIDFQWQYTRFQIKISDIMYIEAYRRHLTVHTVNSESFESVGKLPELLKQLEPHGFVRTHQGFIVNMSYIKRFDTTEVILIDGTSVIMSVRQKKDALKTFDNYLKKWKW